MVDLSQSGRFGLSQSSQGLSFNCISCVNLYSNCDIIFTITVQLKISGLELTILNPRIRTDRISRIQRISLVNTAVQTMLYVLGCGAGLEGHQLKQHEEHEQRQTID